MIEIRGARVINPSTNLDEVTSVYIEEGHIRHIGDPGETDIALEVIDASGKLLIPGLVDFCARTREPGSEHIATIASETRAAVSGGVTTLACPPDTNPVTDKATTVERILRQAKHTGVAEVLPLGAISQSLEHKMLAEMAALRDAGCPAVSDGGIPFTNMRILQRSLDYAATYDIPVILTPLDPDLAKGGHVHEGQVATRLGIPGIPEAAETSALARMIPIVEHTGAKVHFSHLSAARSVDMIADAQAKGLPITADVSAHQLFLTEADVIGFNPNCHVFPPLRTTRDRQVLRDGVKSGVISVICSDHQPHDDDAKQAPFVGTEAGISSIETLLPLVLRLVQEHAFDLITAIRCVTSAPAGILGVDVGNIQIGYEANLCLIDPKSVWQVSPAQLLSAGKNTPFSGWEFQGLAEVTWAKGLQVFKR